MKSSNIDTPLVTVGMVTYNSANFIKDAIESVLSSSYKNFELVIIDDASNDTSWNIIQSYCDSRIISFQNQSNIGEYANRNQIIEKSKGKYLIFIDGDDMIYPHGLEFMTKMLNAFPNSGMALMRWYKNNIFYPIELSSNQYIKAVYFNYGLDDISFANTFFRLETLRKVGPFPNNIIFGDSYARMKIGSITNVLLISDGLTWWRETIGQASSIHSKNITSLISYYRFKISFLTSLDSTRIDFEKKHAMYNLNKEISRIIIGQLKDLKFKGALRLFTEFKLSIFDLIQYRKPFLAFDPLNDFCSHNPARIPINQNPFSSKNDK